MSSNATKVHVQTIFDDVYDACSDLRPYGIKVKAAFRRTFPLMAELIDAAETFSFDRRRHGLKHLFVWCTPSGRAFGWETGPPRELTSPVVLLPEHRLLYRTMGTIDRKLGDYYPESPTSGCGPGLSILFEPAIVHGIGNAADWYRSRTSESTPDADSLIIFGYDGEGDYWVYTPDDKRVFLICFGCEPMSPKWLWRVEGTQILYQVKGGETFTEFVELFAEWHLRALNHDSMSSL